jgi:hypothetical protein
VQSPPATAQTSGNETISGIIVTSRLPGERTVVATSLVAQGVVNGVRRIVAIPNRPGNPDNVARDDLVFADGSMHLVTMTTGFDFSVSPRSCTVTATIH